MIFTEEDAAQLSVVRLVSTVPEQGPMGETYATCEIVARYPSPVGSWVEHEIDGCGYPKPCMVVSVTPLFPHL